MLCRSLYANLDRAAHPCRFTKYNAVLRSANGLVPFFVTQCESLCGRNKYTTTIHVINSGIVKLGKLTSAMRVYRGVAGGSLPSEFIARNEAGIRGGVDMAFSSTTIDKDVALQYASGGRTGLVLTAQMGMVDRGADLSWCSQYPHEKEICFAPLCGVEVISMAVERAVLLVECRFSVNVSKCCAEPNVHPFSSCSFDSRAGSSLRSPSSR